MFTRIIPSFIVMVLSLNAFATGPMWTFTPITPTAKTVEANQSFTVRYHVNNESMRQRTLYIKPIAGVSQTSTCQLAPKGEPGDSCNLNLLITGNNLNDTGIDGGPALCEDDGTNNPDPNQCYQPPSNNQLFISKYQRLAFISNLGNNTITRCLYNHATGALTNCQNGGGEGFDGPNSMAINPEENRMYIVDMDTYSVRTCALDLKTGTLSGCASTGASFSPYLPTDIYLNSSGTKAYVSAFTFDHYTSFIFTCDVNTTSGAFTNCLSSGADKMQLPYYFSLNANKSRAYISNAVDSTITRCTINDVTGAYTNCQTAATPPISNINFPLGSAINNNESLVWVSNYNQASVTRCEINQTNYNFENCIDANATNLDEPLTITLNTDNTLAFILNQDSQDITRCEISPVNGLFSSCQKITGSIFNSPGNLLLK